MTQEQIQEQAEKYANEYQDAFIEGAKWMQDQEQDRWISVKDRLPEFDVHVIVYCKIYGRYLASYRRIDTDYNWGDWRDFNNNVCLPPTHWMPLPQPPKQY